MGLKEPFRGMMTRKQELMQVKRMKKKNQNKKSFVAKKLEIKVQDWNKLVLF
jgi:hypothetical protein